MALRAPLHNPSTVAIEDATSNEIEEPAPVEIDPAVVERIAGAVGGGASTAESEPPARLARLKFGRHEDPVKLLDKDKLAATAERIAKTLGETRASTAGEKVKGGMWSGVAALAKTPELAVKLAERLGVPRGTIDRHIPAIQDLAKWGDEQEKKALALDDPRFQEQGLVPDVLRAAGTQIPILATSFLGAGLGAAGARVVGGAGANLARAAKVGSIVSTAATGAAMTAVPMYDDILAENLRQGVDPKTAEDRAWLGVAIGALSGSLEAFGIGAAGRTVGKLFGKINRASGGALRESILRMAVGEGGTEEVQTVIESVGRKALTDKEIKTLDEIVQAGHAGLIGVILGGGVAGGLAAGQAVMQPDVPAEPGAEGELTPLDVATVEMGEEARGERAPQQPTPGASIRGLRLRGETTEERGRAAFGVQTDQPTPLRGVKPGGLEEEEPEGAEFLGPSAVERGARVFGTEGTAGPLEEKGRAQRLGAIADEVIGEKEVPSERPMVRGPGGEIIYREPDPKEIAEKQRKTEFEVAEEEASKEAQREEFGPVPRAPAAVTKIGALYEDELAPIAKEIGVPKEDERAAKERLWQAEYPRREAELIAEEWQKAAGVTPKKRAKKKPSLLTSPSLAEGGADVLGRDAKAPLSPGKGRGERPPSQAGLETPRRAEEPLKTAPGLTEPASGAAAQAVAATEPARGRAGAGTGPGAPVKVERRKRDLRLRPEDLAAEEQLRGIVEVAGEGVAAKKLAETEPKTGLLNPAGDRRHSERVIRVSRARKGTKAVRIFVDLADLTSLNSLFGHNFADDVINAYVEEWQKIARPGDARPARIGGDEFGVTILTGEDADPQPIIERIEKAAQAALDRFGLDKGIAGRTFGADAGWAVVDPKIGDPLDALKDAHARADEMADARKTARNPGKKKLTKEQYAAMRPAAVAEREARLKERGTAKPEPEAPKAAPKPGTLADAVQAHTEGRTLTDEQRDAAQREAERTGRMVAGQYPTPIEGLPQVRGPDGSLAFTPAALKQALGVTDEQAIALDALAQAMGLDRRRLRLVKGGKPAKGALHQESQDWYYSNTIKALEKWQAKGTVAQLRAHLAKTAGTKEETEWIGLDRFLEDKTNVTRDEVLSWLREHRVVIRERRSDVSRARTGEGEPWQDDSDVEVQRTIHEPSDHQPYEEYVNTIYEVTVTVTEDDQNYEERVEEARKAHEEEQEDLPKRERTEFDEDSVEREESEGVEYRVWGNDNHGEWYWERRSGAVRRRAVAVRNLDAAWTAIEQDAMEWSSVYGDVERTIDSETQDDIPDDEVEYEATWTVIDPSGLHHNYNGSGTDARGWYLQDENGNHLGDELDWAQVEQAIREDAFANYNIEGRTHAPRPIARGHDLPPFQVKWANYKVPGGAGYTEMLLILGEGPRPSIQRQFGSSHWSDKDILAHVRFDERIDERGRRVLFLNEIQSDWHKAIRLHGVADPARVARYEELRAAFEATGNRAREKRRELADHLGNLNQDEAWGELAQNRPELDRLAAEYQDTFGVESDRVAPGYPWSELRLPSRRAVADRLASFETLEDVRKGQTHVRTNPEVQRVLDAAQRFRAIEAEASEFAAKRRTLMLEVARAEREAAEAADARRALDSELSQAAPDAPFKGRGWVQLVMKRMLAWAAEQGYDGIAWSTGKQQAEIYTQLLQHVDVLALHTRSDGSVDLIGRLDGREVLREQDVSPQRIEEILGRGLAARLLAEPAIEPPEADARPGESVRTLPLDEATLTGEGYQKQRRFYEEEVRNLTGDITKKLDKGFLWKEGLKVGTTKIQTKGAWTIHERADGAVVVRFPDELDPEEVGGWAKEASGYGLQGVSDINYTIEGNEIVVRGRFARAEAEAIGKASEKGAAEFTEVPFLELPEAARRQINKEGWPLFQGEKGSVEFTEAGDAVIRGLTNADVSTGVHELAHVARRWLLARSVPPAERAGITDEDIDAVEKWAGVEDGKWTEAAEEQFARGFERYMREGKAPNVGLRDLFAKFAAWLSRIYQRIKGSAIDVKITPEFRAVLDKLVTRGEIEPTVEFDPAFDEMLAFPGSVIPDLKKALNAIVARLQNVRGQQALVAGTIPTETWTEREIRRWQDSLRGTLTLQRALKPGGQLADALDTYLHEELRKGKTKHQLARLRSELIQPLLAGLRKAGISPEEAGEVLMARAAPDRNRIILARDPKNSAGSGFTDADAKAILNKALAGKRAAGFRQLFDRFDRLTESVREGWVRDGLMSREDVDNLKKEQPFYAPMRSDLSEDDASAPYKGTGSGLDVRGGEFKAAIGRHTKADADKVLGYAFTQAEQAIMRGGKNRVMRTFYGLLKAYEPQLKGFAKIHPIQTKKALVNGFVRNVYDPGYRSQPNVVAVHVDGEVIWIEIDAAYQNVADGLKNLGAEDTGKVVSMFAKVTRALAALATRYNPPFWILNAIFKDVPAAFIHSMAHGVPFATRVARDVAPAFAALVRGENGKGKWSQHLREYIEDGAPISFLDLNGLTEQLALIDKELRRESRPGVIGSSVRGLLAVKSAIGAGADLFENMTRFSAYVNAREHLGMSRDRAASFAKNLTVNFERKGDGGRILGAFYMFANAGIQSTARVAEALKNPAVQKLLLGAFAASMLNDAAQRVIGGKDEDGEDHYDKVPVYTRRHSLVFMYPDGSGRHIAIPLPFVYDWFQTAAQQLSGVLQGEIPIGKAVGETLSAAVAAIDPIGVSMIDVTDPVSVARELTPDSLRWLIELATNRDWKGAPIRPERFGSDRKPDSENYWPDKATSHSIAVTRWLNKASGGDRYTPGMIDINPHTLDHLARFWTGGVGRIGDQLLTLKRKAESGATITPKDIPIVSRLMREPSPYESGATFRDLLTQLGREQDRAKGEKKLMSGKLFGLIREGNRLNERRSERRKEIAKLKGDERKAAEEALDSLIQKWNARAREALLNLEEREP